MMLFGQMWAIEFIGEFPTFFALCLTIIITLLL